MKQFRIHERTQTAVMPYDDEVYRTLADRTKVVSKNGRDYMLVPARNDEIKVLRNFGYLVPQMWDYQWPVPPFDSQRITAEMLVNKPRAYVLSEMGTGKTYASLCAYDYLRKQGTVQRMLVVSPLSTITSVWEREVFNYLPHLRCQSLWHSQREKRLKALETEADIYVINHDGLAIVHDALAKRPDIDVVLVDELAVFRNAQAKRWKVLHSVVKNRKVAWGLTGSPTPKAPTDAYAQIRLLTPGLTTSSFKRFRDATMVQVSQFQWVPKVGAKEYVYKQMQPAVRFSRKECIDLPPTTFRTLDIPMSAQQARMYKQMMKSYQTEYNNGLITASNAGVRTNKLLQIACGFAYDEDKNPIRIPAEKRLDELVSLVEESSHKVIVFTPFVESVNLIRCALDGAGIDSAEITGKVGKHKRDEIIATFMGSKQIEVLVCHPQTTAHGLTLTAANTIIWYGPHPSLEIYEQANARVTRPGQKENTFIIHLCSTPIEQHIYSVLRQRGNAQQALLDMFAKETETR